MFESVNKGFGAVRCEPVLSESPSARATERVLAEGARALGHFERIVCRTHCAVYNALGCVPQRCDGAVYVSGEGWSCARRR